MISNNTKINAGIKAEIEAIMNTAQNPNNSAMNPTRVEPKNIPAFKKLLTVPITKPLFLKSDARAKLAVFANPIPIPHVDIK